MAAGASSAQAQSLGYEEIIRATWPDHEEDYAIAIAWCETGMGQDIYNEYSGAYGLFQFLPSTAYGMGTNYGALADPWYASAEAARLQDAYGWSQWACAY